MRDVKFANFVQGKIAEAIFEALFQANGYTLCRAGYESLFPGDTRTIMRMKNPGALRLRHSPDFFAFHNTKDRSWLIQLKSTSSRNGKAVMKPAELSILHRHFPDALVMVVNFTNLDIGWMKASDLAQKPGNKWVYIKRSDLKPLSALDKDIDDKRVIADLVVVLERMATMAKLPESAIDETAEVEIDEDPDSDPAAEPVAEPVAEPA